MPVKINTELYSFYIFLYNVHVYVVYEDTNLYNGMGMT